MNIHLTKFFLLALCIQTSTKVISQNASTTFYDYKWRPSDISKARFLSTLEKTDSGWLRNDYFLSTKKLQMTALYKDSACKVVNGNAIYFHANGNIEATGRKINNKKEGIYISYHFNGMMADSGNYHDGEIVGAEVSWHRNGFMSDSIYNKDDSTEVKISWFDNGSPSAYGYLVSKKKHGKWNYFHKNGNLACSEINDHAKILSVRYFDESGKEQTDTSLVNRNATFKKGIPDWQDYLRNKTYWPAEYKIINSDVAVVVAAFIIDEDGKIEDVNVVTPFHPMMDKIAIEAIKKSPAWKPKIDHNRKVKEYLRQPVTFQQDTE